MAEQVIFGLTGSYLTEKERDFFKKNSVKGFILYKHNIESREQLKKLITDLKDLSPQKPPLILLDQEGGRVARLKPPLIDKTYPPAAWFGKLYEEKGKEKALKAVYDNYLELMYALKEFGVDSPCAPVLDLYHDFADKIVGDRSFGSDVNMVADLATAAVKAIIDAGGIAIIKHIPGHGRALSDSHKKLPRVTATEEELMRSDFTVFKKVIERLPDKYLDKIWAMGAHIVFDCLDKEHPVTLSAKAVNFIRNEIGFKGNLITDDVLMCALHGDVCTEYQKILKTANSGGLYNAARLEELHRQYTASLARAVKQSLAAGYDTVLYGGSDLSEMETIASVTNVAKLSRGYFPETGTLFPEILLIILVFTVLWQRKPWKRSIHTSSGCR